VRRGGKGRESVMQYREISDDAGNVETSKRDVVLYHIALRCITFEMIIGDTVGQRNAG
jgi:hypothetical protein